MTLEEIGEKIFDAIFNVVYKSFGVLMIIMLIIIIPIMIYGITITK